MTRSLLDMSYQDTLDAFAPLAVRMRPRTLAEFVGQDHVLGRGSWLRHAIDQDALTSIILYGPAGTGKTTLAQVIAHTSEAHFVEVSAVTGSVKDLREAIAQAKKDLRYSGMRTILFVDEIHRFSRSQQDALLHAVEKREVILIGATTENPFFEVNTALNSRSRIIEFKPLHDEHIVQIVRRAIESERGLHGAVDITEEALKLIVAFSNGDARLALSTLEAAYEVVRAAFAVSPGDGPSDDSSVDMLQPDDKIKMSDVSPEKTVDWSSSMVRLLITDQHVQTATPQRNISYDKHGDMHYDIISAFIKSMRGSDPDAAVYWLARMIEGGEDPKFIARRIFILASEDIGNADPQAISVASAAFHAASVIGYPECRINLAQAAVYMALAPKSNASYQAINEAMRDVRKNRERAVPEHLRDRHRPGAQAYPAYQYPHAYPAGHVSQQYLPDGLSPGCFYQPTSRGWEGYRVERISSKVDIEETNGSEDECD